MCSFLLDSLKDMQRGLTFFSICGSQGRKNVLDYKYMALSFAGQEKMTEQKL